MVKILIGAVGALGFSKWIESKQINPVLSIGSEILFCFTLIKLLGRK